MVLLEQPVRGSAAYSKNGQIRPTALLVKERSDAAKYKAQAGKVKAQAEQDKDKRKLKRPKRKPDRVSMTISKVSKKSWRRKQMISRSTRPYK